MKLKVASLTLLVCAIFVCDVFGQFRESAVDAFGKRVLEHKFQRWASGRNQLLTDEQKADVRIILADPVLIEATYYGLKALHAPDEDQFVELAGGKFPILEKIIDKILENPQGFVEFLKMIIALFSGGVDTSPVPVLNENEKAANDFASATGSAIAEMLAEKFSIENDKFKAGQINREQFSRELEQILSNVVPARFADARLRFVTFVQTKFRGATDDVVQKATDDFIAGFR